MAALFRRAVARWRSMQFADMFVLPPTNHFAKGRVQSRTFVHFLVQVSSLAKVSQNLSRFFGAHCAALRTWAFVANSLDGANVRFSWSSASSCRSAMGSPPNPQ